jgi:hypothetical protein
MATNQCHEIIVDQSSSVLKKKCETVPNYKMMLGFATSQKNISKPSLPRSVSSLKTNLPFQQSNKQVIINIENKVEMLPPLPLDDDNSDMIVKANYTTDLNILKINEAVRSVFAYKYYCLPKMKIDAENLVSKINKNMTINTYNKHTEEYEALVKQITDIESHKLWSEYISSAAPVLNSYEPLASDETKGIVSLDNKSNPEPTHIVDKRIDLIKQYLDIAKKYIKLDIVHKLGNEATCPGCGASFDELVNDEDSGMCICNCGYHRPNLSMSILYKDGSRVNMGNKNNYAEKQNFIKELNYFDSQIGDPPELLYEYLDNYFTEISFPLRDYWQNQPLNADGEKTGTSVAIMYEALSKTNNSAYFNSINQIVHKYWGWTLIILGPYRDLIMEIYNDTKRVYNMLSDEIKEYRTASLNGKFTLLGIVRALELPFKTERFKIQETPESRSLHNKLWKIMCDTVRPPTDTDPGLWRPVI